MFTFCPMCQLPLQAVKISPEIHVNKCLREWDGTNIKGKTLQFYVAQINLCFIYY